MPVLIVLGLAVIAFALCREGVIRWRGRAERPPTLAPRARRPLTERLTDPREAAAVLLVRQALHEGRVKPEHKEVITALMQQVFSVDEREAEGLFSFGRAAAGQSSDAPGSVRPLLRPVRERCTLAEMKDLVAMLEQVGETGGPMNERQRGLIAAVRRDLKLGEPVLDEGRDE